MSVLSLGPRTCLLVNGCIEWLSQQDNKFEDKVLQAIEVYLINNLLNNLINLSKNLYEACLRKRYDLVEVILLLVNFRNIPYIKDCIKVTKDFETLFLLGIPSQFKDLLIHRDKFNNLKMAKKINEYYHNNMTTEIANPLLYWLDYEAQYYFYKMGYTLDMNTKVHEGFSDSGLFDTKGEVIKSLKDNCKKARAKEYLKKL